MQTHRAVSGGEETLRLLHRSFLPIQEPLTREECIELHREMLLEARETDIERGQTTIGPHRDDMAILLDDVEARVFASQGQQRAAVLALRLAEVTLMTEETGDLPLLLLDDIISELDPVRRGRFFGQLPDDVQAIVTTVEPPQVLEGVAIGQIFAVQSGEFTPLRHSDALMAKGA
jgi:DNA replication and repair protein RecF